MYKIIMCRLCEVFSPHSCEVTKRGSHIPHPSGSLSGSSGGTVITNYHNYNSTITSNISGTIISNVATATTSHTAGHSSNIRGPAAVDGVTSLVAGANNLPVTSLPATGQVMHTSVAQSALDAATSNTKAETSSKSGLKVGDRVSVASAQSLPTSTSSNSAAVTSAGEVTDNTAVSTSESVAMPALDITSLDSTLTSQDASFDTVIDATAVAVATSASEMSLDSVSYVGVPSSVGTVTPSSAAEMRPRISSFGERDVISKGASSTPIPYAIKSDDCLKLTVHGIAEPGQFLFFFFFCLINLLFFLVM